MRHMRHFEIEPKQRESDTRHEAHEALVVTQFFFSRTLKNIQLFQRLTVSR